MKLIANQSDRRNGHGSGRKIIRGIATILVFTWCLLGVLSAESLGQDPVSSKSRYGRARGKNFRISTNGTSVFAQLFRDSGYNVFFDRRLSPRMNRFDTIVWFPNRFEAPDEATIKRIETWFSEGWGRTLIFVERDFDAELHYWQQAEARNPGGNERVQQRIAFLEERYASNRVLFQDTARNRCSWYSIENRISPVRCAEFDGPYATMLNAAKTQIYQSSEMQVPMAVGYDSSVLLSSNGQPLITRLTAWNLNQGSIIIVHNGSMLLNFSLVNSENRKIASELIDSYATGDILFLESDADDPPVSDSASSANTLWAWAAEEPLCYILPHLVWLGLVFCFVYFPIFGRPRRIGVRSNTDFAAHIQATAKLLENSTEKKSIQENVDHALNLMNRQDKSG